MKKIVEVKNIVKSYSVGENKNIILNDISLDINEGDFISIMGPSGSGKSTLLFAISCLDEIDSGEVILQGQKINDIKEDELSDLRRKTMGFVFQNPTMLQNLNILDNIMLPNYDEHKNDLESYKNKALGIMKETGVEKIANRKISEVSGGQLQRASICRAILHEPKILFADEPTGSLNSKSSEEVMTIFNELNKKGITILLVTHDPKVAAKTKRVIFIKDGKIESELNLKNNSFESNHKLIQKNMNNLSI